VPHFKLLLLTWTQTLGCGSTAGFPFNFHGPHYLNGEESINQHTKEEKQFYIPTQNNGIAKSLTYLLIQLIYGLIKNFTSSKIISH